MTDYRICGASCSMDIGNLTADLNVSFEGKTVKSYHSHRIVHIFYHDTDHVQHGKDILIHYHPRSYMHIITTYFMHGMRHGQAVHRLVPPTGLQKPIEILRVEYYLHDEQVSLGDFFDYIDTNKLFPKPILQLIFNYYTSCEMIE